jgi:hypothetical protein
MGECSFDVVWFITNQGLRNVGENMFLITSVDVNIEDINEFSGLRMNKNGWKYDDRPNPKITKKIAKIY